MTRREFWTRVLPIPAAASQLYAQRTRGLPRLTIRQVKAIATSPEANYQWVFLKIVTSEPGLYGIGSASNACQAFSVVSAIEKHLAPFWTGKDPDRIEDLWQSTHVHSYWRNSTV